MKRLRIATVLLVLAPCCLALVVRADDSVVEKRHGNMSWGLSFAELPDVLRMHVPVLERSKMGLLVAKAKRDMPGARWGMQPGDVILQANGRVVNDANDLPVPTSIASLLVLRRGQVQSISVRGVAVPTQQAAAAMPPGFFGNFMQPFAQPAMPGFERASGGVSASSFSGGNESVSVSRSGDQISLDMSLPDLTDVPIRLRGSISQIQAKLQSSDLPAAAKQRVLQAIDQNR